MGAVHEHGKGAPPQDWLACRGRIEQDGTPEEIMREPNSPFVMHFTGDVNQMPSDHQVKQGNLDLPDVLKQLQTFSE